MIQKRGRAEALCLNGRHLMSSGSVSAAEECFREAINLWPGLSEAHTNLGLLLEQKGEVAEAQHHYRLSISLNPGSCAAHLNLGALLAGQKRFEEAEAAYRRAIELEPNSPAAWTNLGVLQACRKQEAEAELSYRTALASDQEYRLANYNLSYLVLRQGRFEEGWSCLEARDWHAQMEKSIDCPRWQGEPLQGRSLFIAFEAGHGDMIQFCRYASVLKGLGAGRIILLCHPALKRLLSTLDAVDQIFAFNEVFTLHDVDFWVPLFSIPHLCRTTVDSIPADIPYIRADHRQVEKWSSLLSQASPAPNLRVGLVWKGNPQFHNDAERSLPLKVLEPLGEVEGVTFLSLQKGAGEEEAANPPEGLPLVNLGGQIADFADSAAILANLDLIICVDTAVAHLAGAMGKECWVLLPDYMTDWRWLTERDDSPWYPGTMRLFRQTCRGDWTEVVAMVRGELQHKIVARAPHAAGNVSGESNRG